MQFTEFVLEGAKPKKGIDHIESLPPNEFIKAIRGLTDFTISEKLDGNNLVFGFDKDGKFYTSREAKGGSKRTYAVNEYTMRAADNGFKGVHAALESSKAKLKEFLDDGDAVEIEVLYGRQPNAIVYGSNYIAFLRMLPGDKAETPDQSIIKKLGNALKDHKVTVTVPVVATDDGVEIKQEQADQKWQFSTVPQVWSPKFAKVNVKEEIAKLEKWLKEKNKESGLTNNDTLTINLTKVPKDNRPQMKKAREDAIKVANDKFILPIKERFLDEILRVMKPALRSVDIESHEDIGVEGIVLLNPKTLQQLKIVDKDVFTIINQFNYAIRNEIKVTSRGRQKFEATLGRDTDIFGGMLQKAADVIGIAGLGEYLSIKRTLRKYKGNTLEETLKNLTNDFKTKEIEQLQPQVVNAVSEGMKDLSDALTKYNKEWKSYTLKLKTGKEIKYTDEIHNRTLIVFAEVREELSNILNDVKKSKTIGDIAVALYGKALNSLH